MNFEDDILKGKFFPLNDRDRLKTTMINLLILLAIILFSLDLYDSFGKGYELMSSIEIATIAILVFLYLAFPYIISLHVVIYATLSLLALFLLISLGVSDINQEISLFWISTLPIAFFYFLGLSMGIKWSIAVFVVLILLTFATQMEWITLLYSKELMLQISIGYIVITYWIYLIEKERGQYEGSLSTALTGQDILFKEVHHRTKNNMQVMMGLLETQSFKIEDPKYKKMFQAHVERIKAMSLVHENLYKSEKYDRVDMHKYLGELSDGLQKFSPHTIITDVDFIFLGIKTSMSIGLIFNEVVSNAIEHAYSAGNGYIDVSLKCTDGKCLLRIKDYGRGFNIEKEHHTLGTTLMQDLSASLPDGKMEIDANDGTEVKVYFSTNGEKR